MLTGTEAKTFLETILHNKTQDEKRGNCNTNYYPLGYGYFQDDKGFWIYFDNRRGDCWVEDFKTEQDCIDYLQ